MKVRYEAANGEKDIWINEHDVIHGIHGVPRIGESVHGGHGDLRYRVVDVIWRPQDDTVSVVLNACP